MDLSGKAALVTGTRRIGGSVAVELARHGADVALAYRRSADEAEEAASRIAALGRRAAVLQADLADAAACRGLVERSVARLGRLDVLVNMASSYTPRPFDQLTADDLDAALAADLRAAYLCALDAVPHFRRSGGGRIINVSDWTAASGRPRYRGFLPYYVAKCAVVGLTEALALELAADGILVNAVAPGPIRPPEDMTASEVDRVARVTPVGRWGDDQEVTRAILMLLESDFLTGETVRVDGGRHLS